MSGLLLAALLVASAEVAATGALADPQLDELSGLAVSRADTGVLWGHNDTGDGPWLYRVGLQGESFGRVAVPDADAVDWEDLAAFEDAGGPALLIGDVGDNLAARDAVTLYAVRDPGRGQRAELLWRLDFEYPDGPRDCEALAVDPLAREILLLSKRDDPPRLYRLPLPAGPPSPGRQRAELLGTLPPVPGPSFGERLFSPIRALLHNAPTAFDISADGLTAVVVTLAHARVYRREAGQDWAAVLTRPAPPIELPDFRQIEAAALSTDGRTLWIGSEGRRGRWARLALPASPESPGARDGRGSDTRRDIR